MIISEPTIVTKVPLVMNVRTINDRVRPEAVYAGLKKDRDVFPYLPQPKKQLLKFVKEMEVLQFKKAA